MRSERSTSYSSTPTSSWGVPISSSAACATRVLSSPTAVSMDDSSAALITRGTLATMRPEAGLEAHLSEPGPDQFPLVMVTVWVAPSSCVTAMV